MNADGHLRPAEELVDGFYVPAWMAKLENRFMLPLPEYTEKFLETFEVDVPVGWELKENRTELPLQQLHSIQVGGQGCFSITQPLHVSEEAAGFYCETEVSRSFPTPIFDGGLGGQPVKAVVDFDCVEVFDVPGQILSGGQFLRVETTAPMLVTPSGGADPDLGCYMFPRLGSLGESSPG